MAAPSAAHPPIVLAPCASTSSTPRPSRRPTTTRSAGRSPPTGARSSCTRATSPTGRRPAAGLRARRAFLPRSHADATRPARAPRAARSSWPSTCPTCSATGTPRAQADVVHFQWLTVQHLDVHLLPRRAPARADRARRPAARAAARPASPPSGGCTSTSTRSSCTPSTAATPGRRAGRSPPTRVHVIPHGALVHPAAVARRAPARAVGGRAERPVVLFFGLMRPYKGIDVLLEAWEGVEGAELWIVGMPRMDIAELRAGAPPGVRFGRRFVVRRRVGRGVRAARTWSCCPTARSTSPASPSPRWARHAAAAQRRRRASPRSGGRRRGARRPAPATPRRCARRCGRCSPTRTVARRWLASAARRRARRLRLGHDRPTARSSSTRRCANRPRPPRRRQWRP